MFFHGQAVEIESFCLIHLPCGDRASQWHQALNALQKLVTWHIYSLHSRELSKCKYNPTGPKSYSCNILGWWIFGQSKPGFPPQGLRQTPEVDSPMRGDVLLSMFSCSGVMSYISISGFLLWTQEPWNPGRRALTRVTGSWVTAINLTRMSPILSRWQQDWTSVIVEVLGFWNINFSEFLLHSEFSNCPSTA